MNIRRLLYPETGKDLEGSELQRNARKAGGYLLGLTGYGLGYAALAATSVTGGLSIPVFGALSAASYAGSRALMRPAYQNDHEYATAKDETTKQKIGRYALFGLGILGVNTGANLMIGGLFNTYESSIGVGLRAASTIGGFMLAKYGIRTTQGSFDPKLYSQDPIDESTQRQSLYETARTAFQNGYRKGRSTVATSRLREGEAES